MAHRSKILSAVCLFLAATTSVPAQQSSTGSQAGVGSSMSNVPIHGSTGGATVVVSVLGQNNAHLDRQAAVKLYDENKKTTDWQTTAETSDATFSGVAVGKYDIEVSAVGYLSGRSESDVLSPFNPTQVKVVLHPDPDAVDLDTGNASLSGKANKEIKRATSELKSGRSKEAQKDLDSVYKAAPTNAHVNFLLGYLSFQLNNFDQAQTYLQKATTLDPHDVQALDAFGRLYLARRDYAAAITTLQQAVAADPGNELAYSMLADAYLNQRDYKNALAQADLAIGKSKNLTGNVQIVRGEALADLGRNKEAIDALNAYLKSAPDTAAAPQVRQLIAALEQRDPKASSGTAEPAKQ
jgi:Tfp pilus assembly protein PilF